MRMNRDQQWQFYDCFRTLSEANLIYKYHMGVLPDVEHQQKITNPVGLECSQFTALNVIFYSGYLYAAVAYAYCRKLLQGILGWLWTRWCNHGSYGPGGTTRAHGNWWWCSSLCDRRCSRDHEWGQRLLSIFHVPDPMMHVLHTLSLLNLIAAPRDWHYYCHDTSEETETQRGK